MKKVFFVLALFTNLTFSQGYYITKENCISIGTNYGRYSSDYKLGINASYTFKGIFDLSYARSTVFTDEKDINYQNEYFIRSYILKGNIFFISGGVGYLSTYSKIELWKDFPFSIESNDFAFELGLHLSSKIDASKNFVASIFYRHFNPTFYFKTPTAKWSETNLARSIIFDLGFIINLNQFAFEAGPRVNIEIDGGEPYLGLNLILIYKH